VPSQAHGISGANGSSPFVSSVCVCVLHQCVTRTNRLVRCLVKYQVFRVRELDDSRTVVIKLVPLSPPQLGSAAEYPQVARPSELYAEMPPSEEWIRSGQEEPNRVRTLPCLPPPSPDPAAEGDTEMDMDMEVL
jgi:hypothetical protein